jgi:hypothetical protein
MTHWHPFATATSEATILGYEWSSSVGALIAGDPGPRWEGEQLKNHGSIREISAAEKSHVGGRGVFGGVGGRGDGGWA